MLQHFRPRCRGALQPRIGRNSHRTIWTNIENMPFLFKYEHISARESKEAGLLYNCLNTSVSFLEIFFRIAHWAKEDPGMARRQVYIKKNSLTSILDNRSKIDIEKRWSIIASGWIEADPAEVANRRHRETSGHPTTLGRKRRPALWNYLQGRVVHLRSREEGSKRWQKRSWQTITLAITWLHALWTEARW